jgi:hypothetical protein
MGGAMEGAMEGDGGSRRGCDDGLSISASVATVPGCEGMAAARASSVLGAVCAVCGAAVARLI